MRIKQKEGTRGSLKSIQKLVSRYTGLFQQRLVEAGAIPVGSPVRWLSPVKDDDWAEYRDGGFLERIGHAALQPDLKAFWPTRGPQWDALGIAGDTVLLVEANAHVGEMVSSCTAEAANSTALIKQSLSATKQALSADASADWMNGYYQLANRLAHLWFLRERGVDARLALLQFTGKTGMPTPSTKSAYEEVFTAATQHLGLAVTQPVQGVVHVFVDVANLE